MSEPAFITKLGTTKRAGLRSRIWLEGLRLLEHDFPHGALFKREWKERTLILERVTVPEWKNLEQAARGTVSGRRDRPVIDITGARVAETFRTERVAVLYSPKGRRISISEVH